MRTLPDLGLLVLRLAGLALALGHGVSKLAQLASGSSAFAGALGQMGFPYPGVFAWLSALAESLVALLVFVGLFTRASSAICAFNMAVAAFMRHHAHLQWLAALHIRLGPADAAKTWGSPELAGLYLMAFVAIALLGPGRIALDARLGRRSGKR